MKTSSLARHVLLPYLALSLGSSTCHAEIYKWVDANGRTHYSERNDAGGPAKVLQLKQTPQTRSLQSAESPLEYWQEKDRQFRVRQLPGTGDKTNAQPVTQKVLKSLSGGKSDGSDASRCNLARDVLSGAVKHRNNAPTDTYDRQVAENDIRAFCRE